jgi:polyphosphate glucokinase
MSKTQIIEKNQVLGVDVGGTGIKGAIIDIKTGELLTERLRVETPQPATVEAVTAAFKELVNLLNWKDGLIGVGFPAVIQKGIALTAANIDKAWIGTNVETILSQATGSEVIAINDADAAGIAEMEFGVGKGVLGTVLLITVGTGLGSALFTDGLLVRNTEFGHFEMKGKIAEQYASDAARRNSNLSWEDWGMRFNRYLEMMKRLLFPDLIIIGGGTSKRYDKFQDQITVNVPIKLATFRNKAGCIGAAYHAYQEWSKRNPA